eukprot:10135837-Ditylum_brightwellii.AAC.1
MRPGNRTIAVEYEGTLSNEMSFDYQRNAVPFRSIERYGVIPFKSSEDKVHFSDRNSMISHGESVQLDSSKHTAMNKTHDHTDMVTRRFKPGSWCVSSMGTGRRGGPDYN